MIIYLYFYRRAVRRFVFENHGLMRRMYGDERHISVLRSEIESNDVDYQSESGWSFHDSMLKNYQPKQERTTTTTTTTSTPETSSKALTQDPTTTTTTSGSFDNTTTDVNASTTDNTYTLQSEELLTTEITVETTTEYEPTTTSTERELHKPQIFQDMFEKNNDDIEQTQLYKLRGV